MADAVLMNKKTPILKIDIADNGMIMQVKEVLNETLLPLQIGKKRDAESVNHWFSSRRIPEKREGLEKARRQFRGFEKDRNYFSLSDQYWVRYNKNETWDKLNFFTNAYSTAVGRIFFEPWTVAPADVKKPCPDRTTAGVLKKHWVRDQKGISHLIKCGSEKYRQEPLSEVLASMMLRQLHLINSVSYDLMIDGLQFCSCCQNFVTPDTEFVPAFALYKYEEPEEGESVYDHLTRMCREKFVIPKAEQMIRRMIVADYVIGNSDRHLSNFGFLRNVETGNIIGFAPLFDFGAAYGTTASTAQRRKSRFFSDVELSICQSAAAKGKLEHAKSTPAMRDLVMGYAVISDQKKELVCRLMENTDREIDELNRQCCKAVPGVSRERGTDQDRTDGK